MPAGGDLGSRHPGCLAGRVRGGLGEPGDVPGRPGGHDVPGLDARIARHKLLHYFQDRGEPAAGGTDAHMRLQEVPTPPDELELSEAPADVAGVYHRAVSLVRDQFEERTWRAFWRVAVEDRSPAEVAEELGITANAVRQAKSRVLRRLKEEMGELIA